MKAAGVTASAGSIRILLALAVGLAALVACASFVGEPATPEPVSTIVFSTPAPASRCVPASSRQMANIRAGVRGVAGNNDVRTGWAVRSKDYEKVWFVAALIYGPGIEKGGGPGVWAISGDPDQPGLTMAVDAVAKEFSDYPDAAKTKAEITMLSDGAREAEACVR